MMSPTSATQSISSTKRLAFALAVPIWISGTSHDAPSEYINPYNKLPWSVRGARMPLPENTGLVQVEAKSSRQAAMTGYRGIFYQSAIISVLVIPIIFPIRRPAARGGL